MRRMEPLAENVHIAADGSAVEIVDQTKLRTKKFQRTAQSGGTWQDKLRRLVWMRLS